MSLRNFATPILRGASSAFGAIGGAFKSAKNLGTGMLLGNTLADKSESQSQTRNVTPLKFSDMVGAQVSAANDPMSVVPNSAAAPVAARNNGRNTPVNSTVLEGATDNLQDIENVLIDIRAELKDIKSNTKPVAPTTPKEKTEEQIKAGFRVPDKVGSAAGSAAGGIGSVLGLGLLLDMLRGDKDTGPASLVPNVPSDGPLDITDSTRVVKSGLNTAGRVAASRPGAAVARAAGRGAVAGGRLAAKGGVAAGRAALTAAEELVTNPKSAKAVTNAGQAVATAGNKITKLAATARAGAGEKIAKSPMAQKLGAAIAKAITKSGPKLVARAVPFLGSVAGGVMGVAKLIQGDMIGAGLAATALVPGAGTLGTLGVAGYEIAREAYNEVYGEYPEGDPKVKERLPELLEEATVQVKAFIENELKGREAQKQNLQSAVDSGLYDEDFIGDSEVDESKIATAKTEELQAIIKDDDINDSDKALIVKELEKRSQLTSTQERPSIPSESVSMATEEVNDATSQKEAPPIIQNVTNNNGGGATKPMDPPNVTIVTGNQMLSPVAGSARFVSDALYA